MKLDVRVHSVTPSRLTFEFPKVANNMAGALTSNAEGTLVPRTLGY